MTWRKFHKWVGLPMAIIIIIFSISGIIMNHRNIFTHYYVPRILLPSAYQIKNFNNGIIKGTLPIDSTQMLAYGVGGVWLISDDSITDVITHNNHSDYGIDNIKISHVCPTDSTNQNFIASGLYNLYSIKMKESQILTNIIKIDNNDERISDVTIHNDTIFATCRSAIFTCRLNGQKWQKHILKTPNNYNTEVSLFKTVWMLHSGELFGFTGRIIVDILGIVLIFLCITGIIFFILPYSIKHDNKLLKKNNANIVNIKASLKRKTNWLRWNLKWHNKIGISLVMLTLILSVTGMCLRPPLMIPLVLNSTAPIPYSTLDTDNAFSDKLRAMRFDEQQNVWILSTSMGFYSLTNIDAIPTKIDNAPEISPMGINVFQRNSSDSTEWLIGSFSGLFRWNINNNTIIDYFTGEAYRKPTGRPIGTHAVSGFSHELNDVVFEYSNGANKDILNKYNAEKMERTPMSLWNFALELHVGRCYEPLLGPFSALFVFIAGLLLTLILISGYIIRLKKNIKTN